MNRSRCSGAAVSPDASLTRLPPTLLQPSPERQKPCRLTWRNLLASQDHNFLATAAPLTLQESGCARLQEISISISNQAAAATPRGCSTYSFKTLFSVASTSTSDT